MDLREVVEGLAALDDEQRASTNAVNRAFDAFARAVLPADRFGVSGESLAALRESLAHGAANAAAFDRVAAAVRARLVRDACAEAQEVAIAVRDDLDVMPTRLHGLGERLAAGLGQAGDAFEELGRLRLLLDRRAELDAAMTQARSRLGDDAAGLELASLALSTQGVAGGRPGPSPGELVREAQSAAAEDGALAGLAANLRAVRDALARGADATDSTADLSERVVAIGMRLGTQRDELRRELARLAQEVERRQAVSHGAFQAITRASDVLDRTATLARRLEAEDEPVPPGVLGDLEAACIGQGIVELLNTLREVRVPAAELDGHVAGLSRDLGELLTRTASRPQTARRLAPLWDELATSDAGALEAEWDRVAGEVLGVHRDADGLVAIAADRLTAMAGADSLEPWRDRLLDRLAPGADQGAGVPTGLRDAREALAELAAEGGALADRARQALVALDALLDAARAARHAYRQELRDRLDDPERGFARVATRAAPFERVANLAPADTDPTRRAAVRATLTEVRTLFARVEAEFAGEGGADSSTVRDSEDRNRELTTAAQRHLAGVLARLRRFEALLLPPLPAGCAAALELAQSVTDGVPAEPQAGLRDELGAALEALWLEKLVLEQLELRTESEHGVLANASRRRHRRLLDLSEASLVLLFALLHVLAAEYDELETGQRAGHLAWLEELLEHARVEALAHAARLEDCLLEIGDNDERLARHDASFGAYHRWAQASAESDAGLDLHARHGFGTYEELEEAFADLGEATLERLADAPADWRTTSAIETVVDLLGRAADRLALHPTRLDLAARMRERRGRAERLRDAVVSRAESASRDDGAVAGLIFGA